MARKLNEPSKLLISLNISHPFHKKVKFFKEVEINDFRDLKVNFAELWLVIN